MIKNSMKTVAVIKQIILPAQLINGLSQLFRSFNIGLAQLKL